MLRAFLLILSMMVAATPAKAQSMTAGVDVLFYGDNTEFDNPFRAGETLLGTAGRLFLDIELNDSMTFRGGLFANGRYGARRFVEQGEPIVALILTRGSSRFIFGSLETMALDGTPPGPDRETPHRLLPPISRETITFTRAHEMGLQWLVESGWHEHDLWINWQRLNTPDHRERFDAGYRSRTRLTRGLALHGQWQVVHEGGQQFAVGPVQDSHAWAAGIEWRPVDARWGVTIDAHAVATRDTPDRERRDDTENGLGVFLRGAIEREGWRATLIVWRSRDTLAAEGDENYLVRNRDGSRFRAVRDYAELGLTRHLRPAPGVLVSASARLHRVEAHYEYSYRVVARVRIRHRIKGA